MQQILDVRSTYVPVPTYLTLGNFDGVHRGHQALLAALQQTAAQHAGAMHTGTAHTGTAYTAILTFDPHPLSVLRPSAAQPLLTTPAERLAVAARLGLDIGIIQPFNMEIAALSAHGFLTLLKAHLHLAGLVVGPDFALGRNREGTLDRLRELSLELDYSVNVIEPVDWQGHAVRSSLIRRHLQEGQVAAAAELLGRLYHATGTVIEGDRRGRLLGTPTANLQLAAEKLWPADGVYATRTWVLIDGHPQPYWSVTNLGVRPTVDGVQHRFETHILDFPQAGHDGNLYGHQLSVEFVERLRGEQRFSGLPELQAQIQADINAARAIFQTVQLPPDSIFSGDLLPAPGSSTGV